MRIFLIALLVLALCTLVFVIREVSDAGFPISTEASISSRTIEQGQKVCITVHAKNRSFSNPVMIPAFYRLPNGSTYMGEVGFTFIPEGSNYPNIKFLGGLTWQKINPRESKSYDFYWEPKESEVGKGILYLELPLNFEPIDGFAINITKKQSEQAAPRNR